MKTRVICIVAIIILAMSIIITQTAAKDIGQKGNANVGHHESCVEAGHNHAEGHVCNTSKTSHIEHQVGTCSSCYGTGLCRVCGGSGLNSSGNECSMCSGKGRCWYCGGSGRI